MTKKPKTLYPDDPVAKALLMMADKKYGCIPIVNKSSFLVGIIAQIDILKIGAQILREGK